MDGNSIGKSSTITDKAIQEISEDYQLTMAGKEVIFEKRIEEKEFTTKKIFNIQSEPEVVAKPKLPEFSDKFSNTNITKKKITLPKINQNSIILYSPKNPDKEKTVVLDARLARFLRPHQIEGIKFMFNRVMGLSGKGNGCILADEMGLGKTLQSICLLWTLLKQGPTGPAAQKVIIVTPSSLVKNWGKEVKKWLGNERLKAVLIGEENRTQSIQKIKDFKHAKVTPLLILSYEQCRQHIEIISTINVGLLICDEAHKLRSGNTKTSLALDAIPTKRRVLLTGTPFQNNLTEFYNLVNFCNPDILGSPDEFRKDFIRPIEKSKDHSSSPKEKKEGAEKSKELFGIVQQFILRRTTEVLEKFLPPKNEEILFCLPTKLQALLYTQFLNLNELESISGIMALTGIMMLKKICNHPSLIYPLPSEVSEKDDDEDQMDISKYKTKLLKHFPKGYNPSQYLPQYSGKLAVLDEILSKTKSNSKDRFVILSFFKQTLNILETMCKAKNYNYLRLDGDTLPKTRQDLVDKFNDPSGDSFIFLLSTKAGGEGLNLIGANRLVLFDEDWNPSYGRQAMARVWRDGQQKEVWIYRLLSTGTIDEKILQRQLLKLSVSSSVLASEFESSSSFSTEELKDIFSFSTDTKCDTFDMIHSDKGQKVKDEWMFFDKKEKANDPLVKSLSTDRISFIFFKSSKPDLDYEPPQLDESEEAENEEQEIDGEQEEQEEDNKEEEQEEQEEDNKEEEQEDKEKEEESESEKPKTEDSEEQNEPTSESEKSE
eukprot:TRINITY_DN11712_c0_g2_i1.p1 TRINITY_DN11712_c0_g2~~TRINITY_DN11712_c0_g2_i1.p1  ORF type:complete len:902 (-),score=298.63 TRINITY_DN11712_c0_g2_i1:2366-4678(-)